MIRLSYAGIGARATPHAVLERMTVIAAWLARKGWHLHSGGAAGADTAFAAEAPASQRTLFLPWCGYRGHGGRDCRTLSTEQMDRCFAIASDLHPMWHRCSPAVRKLHARNAALLLGADTAVPVGAVVAWSAQGAVTGGTGMAIRIAQEHGIPVLNLGVLHPRTVCERLEARAGAARVLGPHRLRYLGLRKRGRPSLPATRRDELGRPPGDAVCRHRLLAPPDLLSGHLPVVRRACEPAAVQRVVLPPGVVGPAVVDQHLPGTELGIAHCIAPAVVRLAHFPGHGPAVAVTAGSAVFHRALMGHPLPPLQVRVAHHARQRRPPGGQGSTE